MTKETNISAWILDRLAKGSYSFNLDMLKNELKDKTAISIKRSLARMSDQKKVISIHKGFYIIIPPSYKNMGVLPPVMFVDDLMNYLKRPYYISLLSAAALHGAAHQQPQSHYICTNLPSLRSTKKSGISIKYISKRKLKEHYIIQKKTESGYVNVSNPLLTCIDLINYNKSVGGINRVATIINELSEEVNINNINSSIFDVGQKADLQRLGYLWEFEMDQNRLADQLFTMCLNQSSKLRYNKLINSKSIKPNSQNNRWNINVNTTIEIDE